MEKKTSDTESEHTYQSSPAASAPPPEQPPPKPKDGRLSLFFQAFKLEIAAFIFTFSLVLTRITSSSMILDKVCLAHLHQPANVCADLSQHPQLKVQAERLAANYQLGHSLLQSAPAALIASLAGPWSDRHGRRVVCVVAVAGMTLDALGSAVCAFLLDSRVEFYYIPALCTGLSGGVVSLLAVVYSYASDLTPPAGRTLKYALLEIVSGLAIPMGAAAGGWIYNFFGYPTVFLSSACGMFVCLLWVIFLLPETRGLNSSATWREKWSHFFSCDTFKESFIATARPRQGRNQIVLLIASMCFLVIATNSTGDISYLYVHHQFGWGNTEYSTVTAAYSVCALLLLLVVVPLFKYKGWAAGDPALGLIGSASTAFKFLGMGLAKTTTVFHVANLMGLLSACAPLAARSRISKVVSNDDLGKVFSFVATAESLLPVLTTIFITQLFNAFISTFPGMPYIVLAITLILPFSVFAWMACLPPLNNEDEKNKKREEYISIEA